MNSQDPDRNCYYGSQSAVAGITGMDRTAITGGLGLRDGRGKTPKIADMACGEGISAVAIQREWSAGRISDKHIAKQLLTKFFGNDHTTLISLV